MATIFAWTGALRKRGELDGIDSLIGFADNMEKASLATIEDGVMTGDLVSLIEGGRTVSGKEVKKVNSAQFLSEIRKRYEAMA